MQKQMTEDQPILLVDDNPTNLKVLNDTLKPLNRKILSAKSGETGLKIASKVKPALVLLDVSMPGIDGFETCVRLKNDPNTADIPVIFLSALVDPSQKVRGFEVGAVDYIGKPFSNAEVLVRVRTQLKLSQLRQQLESNNHSLNLRVRLLEENQREVLSRLEGPLIGDSDEVRLLRGMVKRLGQERDPVFMSGPVGCGGEALARAIHAEPPGSDRPFIAVDCTQLTLSNTGVFHCKTCDQIPRQDGCLSNEFKYSKWELARGGVLFLERIETLSDEYLSHIEACLNCNSGAGNDVRVIAFTTLTKIELMKQLEDFPNLYDAINQSTIRIPALCERQDDLEELANFYLKRHARRLGRPVSSLSVRSIDLIKRYPWPGNFKEIDGVMAKAVLISQTSEVDLDPHLLDSRMNLGSYKLIEKIGEGGMGEVWLASHRYVARPAAIKVISRSRRGRDKKSQKDYELATQRFIREARTTAHLKSPHTVTLFDFGMDGEDSFYYVMEYLEGVDLRRFVEQFGPMPFPRALRILCQVALSLIEAHENKFIHRDIKPANLFLCRLGANYDHIKVLDFGMVTAGRESSTDSRLTVEGAISGTPGYMAPESVLSGTGKVWTPADIYSVGCVAYWLLTGREVFENSNPMTLMMKHVREQPPGISDLIDAEIPEQLQAILSRCLAKEPNARPTAEALYFGLRQLADQHIWTYKQAQAWWEENLVSDSREDLESSESIELNNDYTAPSA